MPVSYTSERAYMIQIQVWIDVGRGITGEERGGLEVDHNSAEGPTENKDGHIWSGTPEIRSAIKNREIGMAG